MGVSVAQAGSGEEEKVPNGAERDCRRGEMTNTSGQFHVLQAERGGSDRGTWLWNTPARASGGCALASVQTHRDSPEAVVKARI